MKGIPDIIVIVNGKFVGLEVKRPKTYQSEAQKEFEYECKKNGGEYYVVRSIDDVMKIEKQIWIDSPSLYQKSKKELEAEEFERSLVI